MSSHVTHCSVLNGRLDYPRHPFGPRYPRSIPIFLMEHGSDGLGGPDGCRGAVGPSTIDCARRRPFWASFFLIYARHMA